MLNIFTYLLVIQASTSENSVHSLTRVLIGLFQFGFLSSLSDVDFSVGIAHLEIFLNFFLLFIMTEHKFIVEFSCFPQFSFAGVTVRVPQTTTYVVNNGLTLGSAGPQLTVHHRPPQVHNVSISACLLDLLSH